MLLDTDNMDKHISVNFLLFSLSWTNFVYSIVLNRLHFLLNKNIIIKSRCKGNLVEIRLLKKINLVTSPIKGILEI
jgi:hypothetical protein